MKFKNTVFLIVISVILTACAEKKIDFEKPEIQVPKAQKIVNKKKGSLYSVQGTSLFADKKDLQIGDIIQVVITEELTNSTNNNREITSDKSINTGTGTISAETGNSLSERTASAASRLNRNFGVRFKSTGSSSFKGVGKSSIAENFKTALSVIIQETYQNGNYYIKGSKQLLIDGQMQEIIISGVIRPYDITPENSIMSTQIANLKILYKKDGEEADATKVPFIFKLLLKALML
ncbi:flagellar basal body L-ring protein FlgH [Arcobacter sp. HD9-500m-PIT-SAG03]|nr:flagellar basal body L-ring protein FlgH [Arcobacter sp. HD9-500m-PIT-SAG03]